MKNKYLFKPTRQSGAVLTEYVVTSSIIIAVLFLPVPGIGVSVVELVINALNDFQSHSTVLLSMP